MGGESGVWRTSRRTPRIKVQNTEDTKDLEKPEPNQFGEDPGASWVKGHKQKCLIGTCGFFPLTFLEFQCV